MPSMLGHLVVSYGLVYLIVEWQCLNSAGRDIFFHVFAGGAEARRSGTMRTCDYFRVGI